MEIYLESIRDLFDADAQKEILLNEIDDAWTVQGLKTVCIESLEEAFSLYKTARATASTNMNDVSSSSHAVFFVDLKQQNKFVFC